LQPPRLPYLAAARNLLARREGGDGLAPAAD